MTERTPGEAFIELVAVMDRLRVACPWDASQTHASLAPYAIEEAYEVADAAERGDPAALRDELGDLLLQVVFHARVAAEDHASPFDVTDVVAGLVAKLRRRHPHVFGDVVVADADEVNANWERIKSAERAARGQDEDPRRDDLPLALPALARAQKVVRRARRAGLPGPALDGGAAGAEADVGAGLLAAVAVAEERGVDAEAALRGAVRDYEAALRDAAEDPSGEP